MRYRDQALTLRDGEATGRPGVRHDPPRSLRARIKRLRVRHVRKPDDTALTDAYRELLRRYRALVTAGNLPSPAWRRPIREAIGFLGGQGDPRTELVADYDHRTYGPFLGVSDEGSAAAEVRAAAFDGPKARALARRASPLRVGVALDAERLGGVGEVPVGPDELAQIWRECIGRTLMTTNIGSRANLRLYLRPPMVTIDDGEPAAALGAARNSLAAVFKPFRDAPGGPRPLLALVEFQFGSRRPVGERRTILRGLIDHVRTGGIAAPHIQTIGLNVRIGWGAKGRSAALRAIDLASASGVRHVSIDGVVRKDADGAVSLPGLLNYLEPDMVDEILVHARSARVEVRPINQPDPDTLAREIWSALNTVRSMGFDLGKYGLVPLTLEECDVVVAQVQRWFPDWCAAPAFYVDQGVVSRKGVFVGADVEKGMAAWLRVVARHGVKLVLFDTVDKSRGWRMLKLDGDPKGLLTLGQVARLNALAERLGVKVLWAGGITNEHAYLFGKLGVFGIYVTTAASRVVPASGTNQQDPGVVAEKEPMYDLILGVKKVLEAGFLIAASARRGRRPPVGWAKVHAELEGAGADPIALTPILPRAWRRWLR